MGMMTKSLKASVKAMMQPHKNKLTVTFCWSGWLSNSTESLSALMGDTRWMTQWWENPTKRSMGCSTNWLWNNLNANRTGNCNWTTTKRRRWRSHYPVANHFWTGTGTGMRGWKATATCNILQYVQPELEPSLQYCQQLTLDPSWHGVGELDPWDCKDGFSDWNGQKQPWCCSPLQNWQKTDESDIRDLKQGRRRRLRERCLKILFPVTAIILRLLHVVQLGKWMRNPRIKLMRTVWTFKEKFENSSSCALVLHMTSNSIISRRSQDENGKEMYQNVKRTCRACKAIVFAYWICKFLAFS